MSGMPRMPSLNVSAYFDHLKRAKELDPEAFMSFNVPSYTDGQIDRQWKAFARARELDSDSGSRA